MRRLDRLYTVRFTLPHTYIQHAAAHALDAVTPRRVSCCDQFAEAKRGATYSGGVCHAPMFAPPTQVVQILALLLLHTPCT